MHTAQPQFTEDSLAVYSFEDTAQVVAPRKPTTPREVLRLLPRDATPAQQDSAIQAMLDIPPVTHLSARPDTLYIPGLKGSDANVNLGKYDYRDNFFSSSPSFHAELRVTQMGMAAEPVPYRLRDDDYVTGGLLLSFFLLALFIVRSSHLLVEKIKNFFYTRGNDDKSAVSTNNEMRYQALLVVQTSFTLAILFFDYTQHRMTHVFNSVSPYMLLGANLAICLSYYAVKVLAYQFVNWVFFDRGQRKQWLESYLLTIMMMGLAAFPLALLMVYFELPYRALEVAFIAITGLSKLLLFIKCRQIFFGFTYNIFHLFLYFCTLELIPILLLWQTLVYCNEILVVNI